MQDYISRDLETQLERSLQTSPVTALIGPRQCGKSTLARHLAEQHPDAVYLDLDLPSDQRKLTDPELFLSEHAERLVCIDEIQGLPGLFPTLKALVDRDRRPGRFLLLGSASRDLVRSGTETMAGRIRYLELTPFLWTELAGNSRGWDFHRLWWRGGFPPAFLAQDEEQSHAWRRDLVQDYLYRDIPALGFSLQASALRRFWQMLCHYHGNILNASKLGQSLDISHTTVRKYVEILEQTFMARVLRPLAVNWKKRLVKSPKVYIRDSGLLHTLLEIPSREDLYGHPGYGASWEGWCIEQLAAALPGWQAGYFRDSAGEEIDLVMERGARRLAFEMKASLSPRLPRRLDQLVHGIGAERTWVVCPTADPSYPVSDTIRVAGIRECLADLRPYGN